MSGLDFNVLSARQTNQALWLRAAGSRYRFVLKPAARLGLLMERIEQHTSPANEGLAAHLLRGSEAERQELDLGLLFVDERLRIVVTSSSDPAAFMDRIRNWCQLAIAQVPAAGCLLDCGTAQLDIDWTNDQAVRSVDVRALAIHRNRLAWRGILVPGASSTAAALGECGPGERLWYRLDNDRELAGPPLTLQPVAVDPNRDRFNYLVDEVLAGADGPSIETVATGICYPAENGSMQFLGAGLGWGHLATLASWTRKNLWRDPQLARLAGSRLLRTEQGVVREVIEDDTLWQGVVLPPPRKTLSEALAILKGLKPGGEYWYWLTAEAPDGGFLALSPVLEDPEGIRFSSDVEKFYRRFERSFTDAVTGTLRVRTDGRLLFATSGADVEHWPRLMEKLAPLWRAGGVDLAKVSLVDSKGRRLAIGEGSGR